MSFDEAQQRLTALSVWLDAANAHRPGSESTILRFLKVGEEAGEMFAEVIGMTGQNPRKGVTASLMDVVEEALDVAITALGAVEHATGNKGDAFHLLFKKIQDVDARRLGTPGPVASDVKIDKFLAATEDDSAVPNDELPGMWESADFMGGQDEKRGPEPHVHTDNDLDPWTSGPNGPTRYTDGCPVSVVPQQ